MQFDRETIARLLITCPDRPGIVASVTSFLYAHSVNITALDQHATDPEGGSFFMRLEFQTPYMDLSKSALEKAFKEVIAERFQMNWRISYGAHLKRTSVLASKSEHTLMDLLWAYKRGELVAEFSQVISNHEMLRPYVEFFGIPFHYVPVTPDTKEESERRILELLGDDTDLVVLARYMQVLSPEFVQRFENSIINIHHSFLPAFAGADPYRQAYERGVKRIGATAHYVTPELDAGPIIEQDVVTVSHRHTVEDLKSLGRDIEGRVLTRAVRWHLEDRIIVDGNKTIVFS